MRGPGETRPAAGPLRQGAETARAAPDWRARLTEGHGRSILSQSIVAACADVTGTVHAQGEYTLTRHGVEHGTYNQARVRAGACAFTKAPPSHSYIACRGFLFFLNCLAPTSSDVKVFLIAGPETCLQCKRLCPPNRCQQRPNYFRPRAPLACLNSVSVSAPSERHCTNCLSLEN
jgi:hypothetical protein